MDNQALGVRLIEGLARVEAAMEGIDNKLSEHLTQFREAEGRVRKLEHKVFTLWVIGPIFLGIAAFLGHWVKLGD